ncbi:MAG: T9SS type A sorting domain-containing protein [Flavobacteriales bacterium]|nr:T9SS type A sorting domain-containing protein [Flavobacteriales bacterium]
MMKRSIFISMFSILAVASFAQHPILNSFDAFRQPNGIELRWVIKGGEQCNGTQIFRAGDDLVFEQIDHIPGICGSTISNEAYAFFDSVPVPNAYNHYKLQLGDQGFTDTVTVFFEDFGNDDFLLLSDHQNGTHRILFSNDNHNTAVLRVFDYSGSELHTQTTTGNDFILQPSGWRSGIYLFRISGVSQTDIHGKIYFGGS